MTMLANLIATRPMVLRSSTAAELMTRNPLTFDEETTIQKASALLAYYNLDAAPVVDQFGRPAGVVTRDACAAWKEFSVRSSQHSFASDEFDQSTVQQIMRPVVEIIHEHDCSRDVIEKLVEQRIRRAYVVNDEGELVGVLSMADVLRHLLASDTSRQASSADASLLY